MMRETIPTNELLNKAHAIGQYYGFTPLSTLTAKTRGSNKAKIPYPEALAAMSLDPIAETVAGFLRQCQHIQPIPSTRQPLFLWHTNIAAGRPAQKRAIVQFHALGTDRALADALVIRALTVLAREIFHEEPLVRINSMGDKETRARYARELSTFFRKRANDLPGDCVLRARENAFEAAEMMLSREGTEELPAPTEHLSDASRKRFEDVLEYLEMTETPYELARNLISRGNMWNDACFEILVAERRVAWGSRYGDITRHFFPSASFSAIGAVFFAATEGAIAKKAPSPRLRFSFVHIGNEAKRLSIRLAEDFRKARIPLVQHIGVESLTEQIRLTEQINSPYLLIMGRKEALEGSVILRNRATQVETCFPLSDIVERLKEVPA
jgi:histidyl-tRNA synthetase